MVDVMFVRASRSAPMAVAFLCGGLLLMALPVTIASLRDRGIQAALDEVFDGEFGFALTADHGRLVRSGARHG